MAHPEFMRQIIPALVTSVALHYPIAYIRSISFMVHNKVVAACFWHDQQQVERSQVIRDRDQHGGCFVYASTEHIRESEVEINGTDDQGQEFIISVPYRRILPNRAA